MVQPTWDTENKKKMATAYEPWKTPSGINLNFLGQSSSVNPGEGSAPSFHGQAPRTELGVHGSFDSPEETAQTSPATVTMACPVSPVHWDATIATLKQHHQRIVSVRAFPREGRVRIEEPYRAERAYDMDVDDRGGYLPDTGICSTDEKTFYLHAVALTGSRANDGGTALVSLMPFSPAMSAIYEAYKSEEHNGKHMYPNAGVLMSYTAEKSSGTIHITLAVEHAVEVKLKTRPAYTLADAQKRTGRNTDAVTAGKGITGGAVIKDPSIKFKYVEKWISGSVTAGEPLTFKWFAEDA